MGIPRGSEVTETASMIFSAFVKYNDNFIRITKRAKERFEKKDFSGSQKDLIERIALYDKSVTRSRSLIADVIGSKNANTEIWERLRLVYWKRVSDIPNGEFSKTFFNSVHRDYLRSVGLNPTQVSDTTNIVSKENPNSKNVDKKDYLVWQNLHKIVTRILGDFKLNSKYADPARDLVYVYNRILSAVENVNSQEDDIRRIEILNSLFFQSGRAFLVGKIIYETKDKNLVIQHFKDDATAFNNQKKSVIEGKGILNNRISEHILTCLSQAGIKNHLVKRINMREQLIKHVSIIPIEFIVRNIATGSLTKRLGIEEGTVLDNPLIEYCLKDDKLGDPLISKEHILTFKWATKKEIEKIDKQLNRINDFLVGMFRGVGIKLVDFKVEFGRLKNSNEVILADEISPDTCRLWDMNTEKKLDKDRFRNNLGNLVEAYQDVARRLGILHEQSNIRPIKFPRPKAVKLKKNK